MSTDDTTAPLTAAELDLLDALAEQASARAMGALWSDTRPTAYDPMIRTVCGSRVVARLSDKVIADALAAAMNALPALLAEVRRARSLAVEVRAVATALAEHDACLACDIEGQEDTCLFHESHELSARLLAAVDGVAK